MTLRSIAIALLFGAAAPAFAEEADDELESEEEEVDYQRDTVTGKKPPPLSEPIPDVEFVGPTLPDDGVHPPGVAAGAKVLKVDVEIIDRAYTAVQALYSRDYKTAKSVFDSFDADYPNTGMAPVGNVLVWQAMMLENFDFKYESQYELYYRKARQQLEQALLVPGNEAWENFLLGSILGVDSIHTMRKGDYLKALNRGFEAMKSVNRCAQLAPEFVDVQLGDGLYNYWRSVVTLNSKMLPDFQDKRAEGIAQMRLVQDKGTFLGPAATLGLTFTWIEEGERKKALDSALKNYRAYPSNIINNLVLGRIYYYLRDYENSERVFKEVLRIDPQNQRVHYHMSTLYMRMRNYNRALIAINFYLKFDLSDSDRALAYYKRGNIFYRLKRWDEAEESYASAVKADRSLKRAKIRLDKVKEKGRG